MELEVDPRVLTAAKIGAAIGLGLVMLWIVFGIWTFASALFAPPPDERPLTTKTQFQYLNWSICEQGDAIQMYVQNQDSTHPSVLKLKRDIALYNNMASDTGAAKFSLDACSKP